MNKSAFTLNDYISNANRIAVITGAGISTNSGIPDFRGPNGLYSRKDIPAELLFDISYFYSDPSLFYTHIGALWESFLEAEPTLTHKVLARLEEMGKVSAIITQNIDGLHQKAGSKKIISAHGDFTQFQCTSCSAMYSDLTDIIPAVLQKKIPHCTCGGVLKPRVVFFGESIIGMEKAEKEIEHADLLLVIGSSLLVYPVASFPVFRCDSTPLVIINKGDTPYDSQANLKIDDDIDSAFSIVQQNL
jgi:NAD-dependent deacetylase